MIITYTLHVLHIYIIYIIYIYSCTNLYKKIMQTEAGSLRKKIYEIIENLDTSFCLWFLAQSS